MEKVEQTFKVFDNFLEITPAEALTTNSIYEIRIKGLKAFKKNKKLDTLDLKVVTELTPSYCNIEAINALVEVFEISEDKLLYYIREASRYADYLKGTTYSKSDTISFEVEQFVKTKASLDALLKAYVEKVADSGSKGTLGDTTFEFSTRFEGIQDLIKTLKGELKKWEEAVRGYKNDGCIKPKANKIGLKANTNSDVTPTSVENIHNDFARNQAQEG